MASRGMIRDHTVQFSLCLFVQREAKIYKKTARTGIYSSGRARVRHV